jgi:hypothetical protein
VVTGEVRERTAMFIGPTGILLLEHSEFGADIFNLVLAGNYTMSEPFEFGVVLPACATRS